MKKGIIKNSEKFYIRAKRAIVSAIVSLGALFLLFVGTAFAQVPKYDILGKFENTEGYKTAIVKEYNEVLGDYENGKINKPEMKEKFDDIQDGRHTEDLLKKSGETELIAEYQKANNVSKGFGIGDAVAFGAFAGSCVSALVLNKKSKKEEKKEFEERMEMWGDD